MGKVIYLPHETEPLRQSSLHHPCSVRALFGARLPLSACRVPKSDFYMTFPYVLVDSRALRLFARMDNHYIASSAGVLVAKPTQDHSLRLFCCGLTVVGTVLCYKTTSEVRESPILTTAQGIEYYTKPPEGPTRVSAAQGRPPPARALPRASVHASTPLPMRESARTSADALL